MNLTAFLLIGAIGAPRADAVDWRPERIRVAGGDSDIWVAAAPRKRSGELPELRIWHAKLPAPDRETYPMPKSKAVLPPVVGDPLQVGSDAEALRLLFSKLSVWFYFPNRPAAAGVPWSEMCREPPLAWAGDAERAVFWALVESKHLVEPTETTTQGDAESQPAESFSQPVEHEPPSGLSPLTLLRLRNGSWARIVVNVPEAETADRFWLAARSGVVHLFWRSAPSDVSTARLESGDWQLVEPVWRGDTARGESSGQLLAGWAGASPRGPVFVACEGSPDRATRLRVFVRGGPEWRSVGVVREGSSAYLHLDPKSGDVAIAGDRLAVARLSEEGGIEFGWCDLDLRDWVAFEPMSLQYEPASPPMPWRDALRLLVALGILTAVLFTRREQMNRPAVLPEGFVLAAVWRRAGATLIDIAPALLAVYPLVDELQFELGLNWIEIFEKMQEPSIQGRLLPPYAAFVAAYGLWCLLWELASGTTLGKRVFDCRVYSADGGEASARQIVIRNFTRVLVLALLQAGILMTLMLMLMFTRNRQRLGDLLAGTIVVQPAAPETEEPMDEM